jgi:hypothetical protein
MSIDAEILDREKQFWTGQVEYYERWLARDVVMVFPRPAGVLDREAVLAGFRSGARWTAVEMEDVSIRRIDSVAIALAYRARARKPGSTSDYVALIGSVYIRDAEGWKLAFHQHTPEAP